MKKIMQQYTAGVKKVPKKSQGVPEGKRSTSIFVEEGDKSKAKKSRHRTTMGDCSDSQCFHEDGGKFAVFEKTTEVKCAMLLYSM